MRSFLLCSHSQQEAKKDQCWYFKVNGEYMSVHTPHTQPTLLQNPPPLVTLLPCRQHTLTPCQQKVLLIQNQVQLVRIISYCREDSMCTSFESLYISLTPSHSVRLQHVPVDQLLFLKTRVRARQNGAAVLVSSEGGLARFWDIFGPREPIGKKESQTDKSTINFYNFFQLQGSSPSLSLRGR